VKVRFRLHFGENSTVKFKISVKISVMTHFVSEFNESFWRWPLISFC